MQRTIAAAHRRIELEKAAEKEGGAAAPPAPPRSHAPSAANLRGPHTLSPQLPPAHAPGPHALSHQAQTADAPSPPQSSAPSR
jgi:hypothetical protein